MPVQVTKLPDEPIIVLTYSGDVDAETIKSAFRQSVELMQNIDGKVYRISDVREIDVDADAIGELFKLVAQIRNDQAGSSADPRIVGVFVGGHQLAKIYADIMRQHQFGGTQIPFYRSLEDALDYIHFKINEHKDRYI